MRMTVIKNLKETKVAELEAAIKSMEMMGTEEFILAEFKKEINRVELDNEITSSYHNCGPCAYSNKERTGFIDLFLKRPELTEEATDIAQAFASVSSAYYRMQEIEALLELIDKVGIEEATKRQEIRTDIYDNNFMIKGKNKKYLKVLEQIESRDVFDIYIQFKKNEESDRNE